MNITASSAAAALLLAMAAAPAGAAIENLQAQASGSGICNSALPVWEGNLRKRPLGIFNQGDSAAYVTCAFNTIMDQGGGGGIVQGTVVRHFGMFLASQVAEPQTVSCTGVIGYDGAAQYVSLEVDVSSETPNSNYLYFYPEDADPGQEFFHQLVAMSCRLPPGVGIQDTYVGFRLDDAS